MWARDGREMEAVAGNRLADLCYLDDRDDEYSVTKEKLSGYGKLGVHGPFDAIFGTERRCIAEVASVYAEQFHRLGYLRVERLLDAVTWAPLASGLLEWTGEADMRRSEVEAAFGPPSLVVDQRVVCYVPADASGWVFFDCWSDPPRNYVPGRGFTVERDRDPLVRNVRIPAGDFESSLILTRYGRELRWGPGWWIHQPSAGASATTLAIAAQLRGIEAADPSQGRQPTRRRRRPG